MSKDKLFLLSPDFFDGQDGPFYCPDSLPIEGLLGFYPQLRENIDVQYIDFQRPRQALVAELGLENQGAPVLILANSENIPNDEISVQEYEGRYFVNEEADIRRYLELTFGLGHAHP